MESLTRQIDHAIQSCDYASLSSIFSIGWQSLGGGEQRSLSAHFIRAITSPSNQSFLPEAFRSHDAMQAMNAALSHLPSSVDGGADNLLRHLMFEFKVGDEDYSGAARVLSGLRLEDEVGSVYYASPAEKCDAYVKIAECYLENEEIAEADGAVQKAGTVAEEISNLEENRALILRYKSTYARVLDSNRKFLQAAARYHDLSLAHADVEHEELLLMLGRAVTCAILAKSGPQRQRILGLVYKDERLSQLDSIPEFQAHSTILRKMYMNQVLRKAELTKFESSLAEHQRAITADGVTIVERAVMEHNMIAASKLYTSIYFEELGKLLGIDRTKAEKVAAKMIVEGQLKGEIDQVDGVLTFEGEDEGLIAWDESIMNVCVQLNRITEAVKGE